jgi:hypothetical protein
MKQSRPVLTSAERQVVDIVQRAEDAMMATVSKGLEDATTQVSRCP